MGAAMPPSTRDGASAAPLGETRADEAPANRGQHRFDAAGAARAPSRQDEVDPIVRTRSEA